MLSLQFPVSRILCNRCLFEAEDWLLLYAGGKATIPFKGRACNSKAIRHDLQPFSSGNCWCQRRWGDFVFGSFWRLVETGISNLAYILAIPCVAIFSVPTKAVTCHPSWKGKNPRWFDDFAGSWCSKQLGLIVKPNLRFDDIIFLGCDTKGVNRWEECDIMLQSFCLITFTTKNLMLHLGAGCFQPRLGPMKITPGLLRSRWEKIVLAK